ncbi:MAG: GDP-mannose 4,6-dehydratase [Nitrospirae bacterium]|nr:GDP-mannose 4,6-dehydratase [Nitrospirota bacterium]
MERMMRALVTGGAGFIGSNLVKRLGNRGYHVTVIDNLKNSLPEQAKKALNGDLCDVFGVEDIRDIRSIKKYFKDVDFVFHLAANADVPSSVSDPEYDFTTNVIGTKNVLECVLEFGCKRVLFSSSAAVYGGVKETVDENAILAPISPYGASKACGEMMAQAYKNAYGLPVSIVRIFNSYGPHQRHYVMVDLFKKIVEAKGGMIEVLGNPDIVRCYCFVSDTIKAFEEIVLCPSAEGEVFNIAGSKNTKISELVDILSASVSRYFKAPLEAKYTGVSWKGDLNFLSGNIEKIKRVVGWEPSVDLKTGVDMLVDDLYSRIDCK